MNESFENKKDNKGNAVLAVAITLFIISLLVGIISGQIYFYNTHNYEYMGRSIETVSKVRENIKKHQTDILYLVKLYSTADYSMYDTVVKSSDILKKLKTPLYETDKELQIIYSVYKDTADCDEDEIIEYEYGEYTKIYDKLSAWKKEIIKDYEDYIEEKEDDESDEYNPNTPNANSALDAIKEATDEASQTISNYDQTMLEIKAGKITSEIDNALCITSEYKTNHDIAFLNHNKFAKVFYISAIAFVMSFVVIVYEIIKYKKTKKS